MLSPHAKSEWTTIFVIGVLLSATAIMLGWWWLSIPILIATVCLILFFRDPDRPIPTQRGIMVSPADGKVSSVHEVEFFEPFNGPATCIRIFLSVFDVHINRSPIHGVITSITHKPGEHLNVLNPESAEVNESNLIIMAHPVRRDTIAAVRQVAGLCARTICCTVNTGAVIQRGQRIGIIKLGSTTELYIPQRFNPQVLVEQGQYVYGGSTILANINLGPAREGEEDEDGTIPVPTSNDTTSADTTPVDDHTDQTVAAVAAVTAVTEAVATDTTEDHVDLAAESESDSDEDDAQATDEMDAVITDDEDEESEDSNADESVEAEEETESDKVDEASNDDIDYVEEPDAEDLEEDTSVDAQESEEDTDEQDESVGEDSEEQGEEEDTEEEESIEKDEAETEADEQVAEDISAEELSETESDENEVESEASDSDDVLAEDDTREDTESGEDDGVADMVEEPAEASSETQEPEVNPVEPVNSVDEQGILTYEAYPEDHVPDVDESQTIDESMDQLESALTDSENESQTETSESESDVTQPAASPPVQKPAQQHKHHQHKKRNRKNKRKKDDGQSDHDPTMLF